MDGLSVFDLIGFVGVAVLIFSFTRLNLAPTFGSTGCFYWLNGLGSFLLLFSDVYRGSWFSVGIGIFWILISALTLLNRLKLSDRALWLTSAVALLYFTAGIAYDLLFTFDGLDSIINSLGMVSTAVCVIIYGSFASGRLELRYYLLIGIAAKMLMMVALMNHFNLASFTLQAYSVCIAVVGLINLDRQAKQARA